MFLLAISLLHNIWLLIKVNQGFEDIIYKHIRKMSL